MSLARVEFCATLIPTGKVLVTASAAVTTATELYDWTTHTWSLTDPTTSAHGWIACETMRNGKVLTVEEEQYDPASGTWGTAPPKPLNIQDSNPLLRLEDGRILATAGGAGGTNGSAVFDPASSTWTSTQTLPYSTSYHSLVTLADGRVLNVGGSLGGTPIASASVFQPATNTWTSTNPMSAARNSASAILLTNNKVLVFGGTSLGSEIYDPSTGTWSPGGALTANAERSAAVMLPNGKVLAAGGTPASTTVQTYDQGTESWSPALPMAVARDTAIAQLLPNGRVLIAGGRNGGQIASAELYDPTTPSWSSGPTLATSRAGATATLLATGEVLVVGGNAGATYHASAERYQPGTGGQVSAAPPATARSLHRASLLHSGKVLVTGGLTTGGAAVSTAEIYDPLTDAWQPAAPMADARSQHTATVLPDGFVLVAGGAAADPAAAQLYDPVTDTWTPLPGMAVGRIGHSATLLASGTQVLVCGGGAGVTSCQRFDVSSRTWTTAASMGASSAWQSATLLPNGQVLVTFGASNLAQIYNPTADGWGALLTAPNGRSDHTSTLLPNGNVLVVGNNQLASLQGDLYDFAANTWTPVVSAGQARQGHAAAILADGRVIILGGAASSGAQPAVDVFDEGRGAQPAWTPTLTSLSPPANGVTSLTGSLFTGLNLGSAGGYQSGHTNFPVLLVRNLENDALSTLPTHDWTATSALADVPVSLPPGRYLATVVVNGVPSAGTRWVVPGAAALLAFLTPPRTTEAGQCSAELTVEVQDASGNVRPATSDLPLSLSSTSATARFFSDAGCTVPLVAAVVTTGQSTATFYARDQAAGAPMLSAMVGGVGTTDQTFTVECSPGNPVCADPLSLRVGCDCQAVGDLLPALSALVLLLRPRRLRFVHRRRTSAQRS